MKSFFDTNKFIAQINEMCSGESIEYIDAVIVWCERNNIELEFIAGVIKKDPLIKSKIQLEAEQLNFIKPAGSRLPI